MINIYVIMSIKVYQYLLISNFMDKKYITIKEAAKILGVSPLTLRNWDNSGRFPAGRHPISNYRVYKVEDINDLIAQMDKLAVGVRRSNKRTVKKLVVKHLD